MTKAATQLSQIKLNECVSYKTSLWYVNFHSNIRKTTEVQRGQRVGAWIAGESVTKLLNYLMRQEEQCWKWYMICSSSYDIWTWTNKLMLNRIAAKKTPKQQPQKWPQNWIKTFMIESQQKSVHRDHDKPDTYNREAILKPLLSKAHAWRCTKPELLNMQNAK